MTDRRTDGRTDGQTDRQKTIYLPTLSGGDIIKACKHMYGFGCYIALEILWFFLFSFGTNVYIIILHITTHQHIDSK